MKMNPFDALDVLRWCLSAFVLLLWMNGCLVINSTVEYNPSVKAKVSVSNDTVLIDTTIKK
jgi:hypothetical protein